MKAIQISQADREAFDRDGVICVRGIIDEQMIEGLRAVLPAHLDGPTSVEFDADVNGAGDNLHLNGRGGPSLWSRIANKLRKTAVAADKPVAKPKKRATHAFNGWQRFDIYRDLIFKTDIARTAADLMKSSTAQIIYDETFNKEPGALVPVNWHQDDVYWPISGSQTCSVWIALDAVTQDSGAVCYIAGSHRWNQRFRIELPRTAETEHFANIDLPDPPNYFKDPNATLLSWDLQPGDALFFAANTLHGSRGNSTTDRSRRAVTPRFLGDDIRFVEGAHVANELFGDISYMKTGDRLTGPSFPMAWRKA